MTSARFDISIPQQALHTLRALEAAGHEAWFVGPCVRDLLLARDVESFDIATSARAAEILATLDAAGYAAIGHDETPTCISVQVGDTPINITPYRPEGAHADRGRADAEPLCSINTDLSWRGFTIDALALHPDRGILDNCNGLDDLEHATLRSNGDASERFSENALHIARGCRLASQLGLFIEPHTFQAMTSHKMRLAALPASRIVPELDALLLGEHAHDALMQCIDVIVAVIPELAACKGFEQRTPYHIYDVWEHTAWVVQRSPATSLARWTALFHDIGKPAACFMEGERAHFFGHARLSVIMARDIMRRLDMPEGFMQNVLELVLIHDKTIPADEESVRLELARLGGDIELLRTLCGIKRADSLAQSDLALPRLQLAESLQVVVDSIAKA